MSVAVYYDDVTGRVTAYDTSANTPVAQAAGALINPDLSAVSGYDISWWMVSDGAVIVSPDGPDFATYVYNKLLTLSNDVNTYLTGKYDDQAKLTFNGALSDPNRPNRKAYVLPYLNWADLVLQEWLTRTTAVLAATTVAEVDAVADYDWATFEAAHPDPEIKVWAALSIPD